MKVRPFLLTCLTVAVVLLGLGAGGWALLLQRSPLRQAAQVLEMPEAARFIPRRAPLSLHLLTDPDWPARYAAAVAPPAERSQATEALLQLRDGAFAAAGLDYPSELAGWIGSEASLSVLQPRGPESPTGWLLALRSRDEDGARRFLQRFWQVRSLAGADLTISTYRGMGLISGRGALLGRSPEALATALINDRLVLIASGRGVLEEALDVSQIDDLNLASDPLLTDALGRLETGVGLLTARPEALVRWFSLPPDLVAGEAGPAVVAALQPRGTALMTRALLPPGTAPPADASPAADPSPAAVAELLPRFGEDLEALAVIEDPAALLAESADPSPQSRILAPALTAALEHFGGVLLPRLARADGGPMVWAGRSEGWLVGTEASRPDAEALSADLRAEGLVEAPLTAGDLPLQVWTRLREARGRRASGALAADLAGARLEQGAVALWSDRIDLLRRWSRADGRPAELAARLIGLGADRGGYALALDSGPAAGLLARWLPWNLLQGIAARPLADSVAGLDLVFDPGPSVSRFDAQLLFR